MDRIWVGLDRVTLTSANKPPHTRPQQLHRHRQARLRVAVAWEEDRITMCKDSILIDVNIREWGAQWKQKDASTSELVTITWSRHILLRDLWRFYDLKDKLWVFGQEFLHLFFFFFFFLTHQHKQSQWVTGSKQGLENICSFNGTLQVYWFIFSLFWGNFFSLSLCFTINCKLLCLKIKYIHLKIVNFLNKKIFYYVCRFIF